MDSMKMIEKEVSSRFESGKVFPPGFRFHPTDEELILYYLKRKICRRRLQLDVIAETDVYKWDPQELPGISKLKTGDRQWFFFSSRDRRYPNAARSNRSTRHGYWKATGKDRIIKCDSRAVGVKKTLVFYQGRPPNGERTDWVMHEYTMDEEELSRCEKVKDYFALYKVFKKSGPGPKNGEQYGAPFREEDWEDEEHDNGVFAVENTSNQVEEGVVNNGVDCLLQSQLDDLEEFMSRIADEPVFGGSPPLESVFSLDDLLGEEEAWSNLIDKTSKGTTSSVQSLMLQPACQQVNVQASYGITQSDTSHQQLHDTPEVTSVAESHVPEINLVEEDFLEDFLEMDDLLGPEPTAQTSDKPIQALNNLHSDEFDGLGEFDLFDDAPMFFCENEMGYQGPISQQYLNNTESEVANPVSSFNSENPARSLDNYEQTYLYNINDPSLLQHSHDQRSRVYSSGAACHGTKSPLIPGEFYDGRSTTHQTGANQNINEKQDDGTDSWLSSALWSFVESIPTNPASAAESALVNRAFQRVSSFSRVTINARTLNVATGSSSATSCSSGKCRHGLFCFSLLGIVCAILWMLIGMSAQVLGRCMSSA